MTKIISTYRLRECIGVKASLSNLGIKPSNVEVCIESKKPFLDYIEPTLTFPLDGYDTPLEQHPQILLISAAGATGKTAMCRHLSSTLNIPVFDLGKAREVASHSLTGALVKEFGSTFSKYLDSVKDGEQALIIDALDEGLAKSGAGAFNAFLDDVISLASDAKQDSVPVIMLGRTQAIDSVSNYLDKNHVTYSWLQISAFNLTQASEYVDKKAKPAEKYSSIYKELKNYIFAAIGSFVSNQSQVDENFLGYAPVLDAISAAIRQNRNYQALLEEYKKNSASGIFFILDVIEKIVSREKNEKVNVFISKMRADLTPEEYNNAQKQAYSSLEQCKALMATLYNDKYRFNICSEESINTEFTDSMAPFIEDHPFLNGKHFENTVFESYVLARLMIEDPDNIYLSFYLTERYRDAYMLFYFLVEIIKNRQLQWRYVPYVYRSLISFDSRNDHGQTFIIQGNDTPTHSIRMMRQKDEKELEFECELDKDRKFSPGNVLSNIIIDSQIIDVRLDAKSLEITPPVVCLCNSVVISSDIVINELKQKENDNSNDLRVIFECRNFNVDFQAGHRPTVKLNKEVVAFSVNSENKLIPPYSDYGTNITIAGNYSDEFRSAFVKLRKILITFRSHSKGSMARYKGKIDDSRISGHDVGKSLIKKLLQKGIIEEDGCMYHLNLVKTAEVLGLTFDMLQTTSPTPKMVEFIKDAINEK